MFKRILHPLSGFVLAVALWQLGICTLRAQVPLAAAFAPWPAWQALLMMLQDGYVWHHIAVSLQRVAIGLLLATICGVPLGIVLASSRGFAQRVSPLFQFLRMVSPLSWMPLAVMVFGVGDAPVYFLLAFAALWPIMLNTVAGVAQLDANWLLLAGSLSATRREVILRVILPGITAHLLTGIRLAIGIIWIVLVPAEMLGVSAGLGYFILDTRDRLAYPELMAAIVLIGFLGFLLDYAARAAYRRWLHAAPGQDL